MQRLIRFIFYMLLIALPFFKVTAQAIDSYQLNNVRKYFPKAQLNDVVLTADNMYTYVQHNFVQYNEKWSLCGKFEKKSGEFILAFLMLESAQDGEEHYLSLLESLKTKSNLKLELIPNRDTAISILHCLMADQLSLPLALQNLQYVFDSSESALTSLIGYNRFMNMGILIKIPKKKTNRKFIHILSDGRITITQN